MSAFGSRAFLRQAAGLAGLLAREAAAPVRRAPGGVALAGFSLLLLGGAVTLVSSAGITWLLGMENVDQQSALLVLVVSTVFFGWLALQVAFGLPITFLLGVRPLRVLPVSDRYLHWCRIALSLGGVWLLVLGPAVVLLIFQVTLSPGDLLLSAAALVLAVLIQGRIIGIAELHLHRLLGSWLGFAAAVVAFVLLLGLVFQGASTLLPEGAEEASMDISGLVHQVAGSPLPALLRWLPPGLLATLLAEPGVSREDLVGLAALLTWLAVLVRLERPTLFRGPPSQTVRDGQSAPLLPLAWLMRCVSMARPAVWLALLELEAILRQGRLRLGIAMTLALCLWDYGAFEENVSLLAMVCIVFLNAHRGELAVPGLRLWRYSSALPFSLEALVQAAGRATLLLQLALTAVVLPLAILRNAPVAPSPLILGCTLIFALLWFYRDGFNWYEVRWQKPSGQSVKEADLRGGKLLSMGILLLSGLHLSTLMNLSSHEDWRLPTLAATLLLGLATLGGFLFRSRCRRELERYGVDGLVDRPQAEANLRAPP